MKNERQTAIAELISENDIEKQEDLIALLQQRGFRTAQATISRDLRQLNIVKVNNGHGGFRYALPSQKNERNLAEYAMAYAVSVISVDYSMNLIVIKTHNGMVSLSVWIRFTFPKFSDVLPVTTPFWLSPEQKRMPN